MTDILMEFPKLKDQNSDETLMTRTILIANTSNMPVAAREASVYTGITIAEYYRDMGYSVAFMADSTSRWAEAMREISGRLEEMPGEEGYPAYLSSKIAAFYERAGKVQCLSREDRQGDLTIIGAVSPAGGDLSDPVVQSTLRVVKIFWSLEDKLAFQRHFPAISWLRSYSLYSEAIDKYVYENFSQQYPELRKEVLTILEKESELEEIIRIIGIESLSDEDRLLILCAAAIRENFLHQNAFDEKDSYTHPNKQILMLSLIIDLHHQQQLLLAKKIPLKKIEETKVFEELIAIKYISNDSLNQFGTLQDRLIKKLESLECINTLKKESAGENHL